MEVKYRRLFLKDMKRLSGQPIYNKVFELAFSVLPKVETLKELRDVKIMKGCSNRYRIRLGNYRVGIEVQGNSVEIMRVLHRREFYRFFP